MNRNQEKTTTIIDLKIEYDFIIAVFDGIKSDLTKLELSFLNLKVTKVNSKYFEELVMGIDLSAFRNHTLLPSTLIGTLRHPPTDEIGCSPYMYAFVQVDAKVAIPDETFKILEKIMLLLFPSDFRMLGIIYYNLKDTSKKNGKFRDLYETPSFIKNNNLSRWQKKFISLSFLNVQYLEYDSSEIKKINDFVKLAYFRLKNLRYLSLGIESYKSSYEQNDPTMGYICLCIAIETLTSSRTEVTHRIARTCAILNAEDKDEGTIIEFNTKQFYDLRSHIVHGEDYDKNKLIDYYYHLQALVSRTFIELISLNIPNKESLTEIVSRHGYGDKAEISKSYKHYNINSSTKEFIKHKVNRYDKK